MAGTESIDDPDLDYDHLLQAANLVGDLFEATATAALIEDLNVAETGRPSLTTFHARTAPFIGIACYFERIHTYSKLTPTSAICAAVLAERVCRDPLNALRISQDTAHRLMVTACMVTAKFYDPCQDPNSRWAKIAGFSLPELNGLEIDFLNACGFSLRVTPEEFREMVHKLISCRKKRSTHPPTITPRPGSVTMQAPRSPVSPRKSCSSLPRRVRASRIGPITHICQFSSIPSPSPAAAQQTQSAGSPSSPTSPRRAARFIKSAFSNAYHVFQHQRMHRHIRQPQTNHRSSHEASHARSSHVHTGYVWHPSSPHNSMVSDTSGSENATPCVSRSQSLSQCPASSPGFSARIVVPS